jgi:hypothetical protein
MISFHSPHKVHEHTLMASYLDLLSDNPIPSRMLTPRDGRSIFGAEAVVAADASVISLESASFCASSSLSSSKPHCVSLILHVHIPVSPLAFAMRAMTSFSPSSRTPSLPFPVVECVAVSGSACWLVFLLSVMYHELGALTARIILFKLKTYFSYFQFSWVLPYVAG